MDLQVVGENDHRVDELLDEDASLGGGGEVPRLAQVDLAQHGGDLLEAAGQLVAPGVFGVVSCLVGPQPFDLGAEAGLLLGEGGGGDLVGVVQLEELLALGGEGGDASSPAGAHGVIVGGDVPAELGSDGRLEVSVRGEQSQAEHSGPVQPVGRAARLAAAFASVPAAEEGLAALVVVDGDEPVAQSATDSAREWVATPPTAGDVAPVGSGELLNGGQRFVDAGEPLVAQADLAEVHPVVQHLADCRVLHADGRLDGGVAVAGCPEGEHALDDGGVVVGDEVAVDHVVARRGPVEPATLAGCLLHAHLHVLDDVLSVELGEDAVHADLHSAGGGGDVDLALVDRVYVDAVGLEEPHEAGQVAAVTGEAVEAPDDDIGDLVGLDQREEPLYLWPLEVLAGEALVGHDRHGAEAVLLRMLAAARRLGVGRVLDLVFGGHSDVANGEQRACLGLSVVLVMGGADRLRRSPRKAGRCRRGAADGHRRCRAARHPLQHPAP